MREMVDVLFAGSFFPEASKFLQAEIPGVRFAVADPRDTSTPLPGASILVPLMSRIDGDVMDRIEGLKLIQQWGAGLEGVDIEAATTRGIAVGNIPTMASGNASSVAEWCVMVALAMSRHLLDLKGVMSGGTRWGSPIGTALGGRTAAIVGFGGIGQALAKRLVAFDMHVIVATRTPDLDLAMKLGVESVVSMDGFQDVLTKADYLFLALPLSRETSRIIDSGALSRMKPGSYLINAGRGGLVDADALLASLDSGHLAGAALDVFDREPLDPSSPLIMHPRTIVSPHIAGVTDVFYRSAANRFREALTAITADQPLSFAGNWASILALQEGRPVDHE